MNINHYTLTFLSVLFSFAFKAQTTGTWTPVATQGLNSNAGVMLLLTDGSVICKTDAGSSDGVGNSWNRLTPDASGSYVNGSWSFIAQMIDSRLYFSSQVLRDGTVYVAGGEYGTGGGNGEIYYPQYDIWGTAGTVHAGDTMSDANSQMLPDGRILQAVVKSTTYGYNSNLFYNPVTMSYTHAPSCHKSHDESAWLKLPDNSILFVDINDVSSERFIPSLNQWVVDATVPVSLYEPFGEETGASFLLPDGRGFFIGGTSKTAYYTPSGTNAPGTWAAGPDIPNGLGAVDAAAAMMVNGKILCAFSPSSTATATDSIFKTPTYFYEFDYLTNTFTQVQAPNGTDTLNVAGYVTNMLDLPDGTVLYASQGSAQYYIYTPAGSPLASGKPTINSVNRISCDTLMLTGTLFNGISQGAAYGDDWQMATNYPIVRLSNGTNVYYAKTFNWNSYGVMRGNQADTTYLQLPAGMPPATYSMVVTANGISSDPVILNSCVTGIHEITRHNGEIKLYPNPAQDQCSVSFTTFSEGPYTLSVEDVTGRLIATDSGKAVPGNNTHTLHVNNLPKGAYLVTIRKGTEVFSSRLMVK
ncbi:MAG: T9SS type A sorting domain-containing protein [Bacteroidetes bacterium]|nr:T9SS type A sorting domain-containing protein [Bacteroidota bacterium]